MHAFTSVVANYIPKARVLAWSFKRFHPEAKFHLVLSDTIPEWLGRESEPFDSVITIEELPIAEQKSWIFKHTIVELSTAVKGCAFQEISRRYDADKIFYFDPDIVILSPLDDLLRRLDTSSILLTPHQIEPDTSPEAISDNEITCLRHGVYNLGFLGVRTSEEGKRFIDWWSERLRLFCYDDVASGLFTDQRWIDLVPSFFEDIDIVKDPVYNVSTWNLTHRKATGSLKTGIEVNGKPICFYHFSGFDSGDQEVMLHKYGGDSPVLKDLRRWYIEECKRMGQDEFGRTPWVLGSFDNGEKITKNQRILYRSRQDLQDAFSNPYATADVSRSYFDWYAANTEETVDGSLDSVEELNRQVFSLFMELDSIKRSRTWPLNTAIWRTSDFLKGVVKKVL